jgi:hypothetical protein
MAQPALAALLSDGIQRHIGLEVNEVPLKFRIIFKLMRTDRRFITVAQMVGFDTPQRRNIGGTIAQTNLQDSFTKVYYVDSYGLGTAVAEEDMDDDPYGILNRYAASTGGEFARAFATQMEVAAFAFLAGPCFLAGTNIPGFADGLSLFNTAHPVNRTSAVLVSNRPNPNADLSYGSMQAASIMLRTQRATNGWRFLDNPARRLLVHTNQGYVANQVVKLAKEYGTANHNENLLKEENIEVVQTPYFQLNGPLSAAGTFNGWVLQGRDHTLSFVLRQALRMKNWYHGETNSQCYAGTVRYAIGADDFRGLVGSPGN